MTLCCFTPQERVNSIIVFSWWRKAEGILNNNLPRHRAQCPRSRCCWGKWSRSSYHLVYPSSPSRQTVEHRKIYTWNVQQEKKSGFGEFYPTVTRGSLQQHSKSTHPIMIIIQIVIGTVTVCVSAVISSSMSSSTLEVVMVAVSNPLSPSSDWLIPRARTEAVVDETPNSTVMKNVQEERKFSEKLHQKFKFIVTLCFALDARAAVCVCEVVRW